MALTDGPIKDAWESMTPGRRHAISLVTVGVIFTFAFVTSVREPLNAATETNARQDAAISSNKQHIDTVEQALADLARTQAVQAATIASMQRQADHTDTSLERIEGKIDQMRRGR